MWRRLTCTRSKGHRRRWPREKGGFKVHWRNLESHLFFFQEFRMQCCGSVIDWIQEHLWLIIRWCMVVVAIALSVWVVIYAFTQHDEAMLQKIPDLEFNDPTRIAVDNKLSTSRAFFQ